MANLTSRVLLALSVFSALFSLLLPYIQEQLQARQALRAGVDSGDTAQPGAGANKCPLGFAGGDGSLPAGHPEVLVDDLSRLSKASQQAKHGAQGDAILFFNGTILTWYDKAPLAEVLLARKGKVAAVGSYADIAAALGGAVSAAELRRLAGEAARRADRMMAVPVAASQADDSLGDSSNKVEVVEVVDLQGTFAMPGFVDPHVHLIPGGLSLTSLLLHGVTSRSALEAAVQAHCTKLSAPDEPDGGLLGKQPPSNQDSSLSDDRERDSLAKDSTDDGSEDEEESSDKDEKGQKRQWLRGSGWDEASWGGGLPDRSWIDKACGADVPMWLTRMDGHMGLANTAALEAAGLLTRTSQQGGDDGADSGTEGSFIASELAISLSEEGLVDLDADGLPTGIVREGAVPLVTRLIPRPSLEQRRRALAAGAALALSRGVTTVGDMGMHPFDPDTASTWRDFEEVYLPAADSGELPVRIMAYVPLSTWLHLVTMMASRGSHHAGSGRLFWGGLKEFSDGSLGSRTALMWQQYSDLRGSPLCSHRAHNATSSSSASDAADSGSSSAETCDCSAAPPDQTNGAGNNGDSNCNSGTDGAVSFCVNPACCGQRVVGPGELQQLASVAARAGLQVAVHAIGDRAVDDVTEVLAGVGRRTFTLPNTASAKDDSSAEGVRTGDAVSGHQHLLGTLEPHGVPMRIEHVQHISGPEVLRAMAAGDIAAVGNPLHLLTDAPALVSQRLGQCSGSGSSSGGGNDGDSDSSGSCRAHRAFAFGSMLRSGLRPAFGSDWPVVDLQPLTGVYAAVHRHAPPPDAFAYAASQLQRLRSAAADANSSSEALPASAAAGGPSWEGGLSAEARAQLGMQLVGAPAGSGGHDGHDKTFVAEERIPVEAALRGHTVWAADAMGLADQLGALRPGSAADIAVLSHSPLGTEQPSQDRTESAQGHKEDGARSGGAVVGEEGQAAALRQSLPLVLRTYVAGRCAYSLPEWRC